jgi:hypothetical protein
MRRMAAATGWLAVATALMPGAASADAERALRGCTEGTAEERRQCEANAVAWRRDWAAAVAGDQQAQRNLALALSGRLQPAAVNPVRIDQQAACFWRVVVLRSARPGIGPADWDAEERDCRRADVNFRAAEDDAARFLERLDAGAASPPYAPPGAPLR